MNALEVQQVENVKRKQQLLQELDLPRLVPDINADRKPRSKRQSTDRAPLRTSARIASAGNKKRSYKEDAPSSKVKRVRAQPETHVVQQRHPPLLSGSDINAIRSHWTDWSPVALPPTRDEFGTFHFQSHLSFTPNKSPEEVIREGCFGGSYFRPLKSQELDIIIDDDYVELPQAWISGLDVPTYLTSPTYNPDVNKFKVACGQSIEEWEAAGWINHDYDIRGWFQWYVRFFRGRRCQDDDRQVSRWKKCVGESGRWRRMLLKRYVTSGVREVFDDGADEDVPEVSPVMHQTCHHWAFEVKQNVLDQYWAQA